MRWHVRRAEHKYPAIGHFVTVGDTRLHFVRKGTGKPVVLLHGSDGFLQDYSILDVSPEWHAYPLHKSLAHSKLIVLPKTGHEIPHTRSEAVMEAIDAAWAEMTDQQ